MEKYVLYPLITLIIALVNILFFVNKQNIILFEVMIILFISIVSVLLGK